MFDLWEDGPNTKAAVAWDINQLHWLSEKGFKEPWRSVRISGKCYDSAAVNYAMFGLMAKLCDKKLDFAIGRVELFKHWAYNVNPDPETIAWTKAGYNGWTPKSDVYSFTPYSVKDDPKRKVYGKSDFTFTWLPFMYQGTEGDYDDR